MGRLNGQCLSGRGARGNIVVREGGRAPSILEGENSDAGILLFYVR